MKRVYKYKFPVQDSITLHLPEGAVILKVGAQGPREDQPVLWALVDTNALEEVREFKLRGTGHPCAGIEASDHVATFETNNGRLVWHLFKVS